MAQELSLKQFSAELAGGFRKWSEQGQHPLAAFPTFISYIMDQHEYQRSLCKHIAQDGEMIKLGNTGVPVQHREEAQYVIAGRLSEAQMFLHALEIHLICARKVNAYFVNRGHFDYEFSAEMDGLVHRLTGGFNYFEGRRRLFTKTWDEISQLCIGHRLSAISGVVA
ncbi:hypothetical protein MMC15_000962 [Xylographa vitiligo]|nr:hypothetical protein [Xylographa vitiligo]